MEKQGVKQMLNKKQADKDKLKFIQSIIKSKNKQIEDLKSEIRQLQADKAMYQECFDKYIPDNMKDEATLFLSIYGSGLAKDLSDKEK